MRDNKKISNAAKWSTITEILAKFIQPITNMILARLLTPEAFGVIATITMITSFVDIFTDVGFQKYLIQHEFTTEREKWESTTVAFWTNLVFSLALFFIIFLFREPLATSVGNEGLGNVIFIACISLPITSFSSIQIALFKREFDFKTLFKVRIVGVCIPLFVTVPLAFLLRSYWALVIGGIIVNLSNSIILTLKSEWKPQLFYSYKRLKEMMSFSLWTLLEQLAIWLTSNVGTFIIGLTLTDYYLGIYKTAMASVNQIMALITSAIMPVLFSALSRVQENKSEFENILFKFERIVGVFVLPMGVGIFIYRELITDILLGSKWIEAANFIGLWGVMSGISILFINLTGEVFRSLGKPKLSVLCQVIHLVILIPTIYYTSKISFTALYVSRSLIKIQGIITSVLILYVFVKISPLKILKNILPSLISTIIMSGLAIILRMYSNNIIWSLVSIFICIIFYFTILIFVSSEIKRELYLFIKPYLKRIKIKGNEV